MNEEVLIGGGIVGETLAGQLADGSVDVVFLSEDDRAVERAAAAGVDALAVSPSDPTTLDQEGIADVETVIVASREDGRNLLVTQLLRRRTAERVIALVNDPNNIEAFAAAGVEPVCATSTLAAALDRQRREGRSENESGQQTIGQERLRSNGSGDA